MYHDKVAQGRGGEQLAIHHAAEDAKSNKGRGGGSRTDTAVDECRNQSVDPVALYCFD